MRPCSAVLFRISTHIALLIGSLLPNLTGCAQRQATSSTPSLTPGLYSSAPSADHVNGLRDETIASTAVASSAHPFAESHPLYLDSAPAPGDALRFALEGAAFYGPAKGYVQTPLGGAPSTTSAKRPRLGELGINSAVIGAGTLTASWDHNEVFGSAEFIRLSGSGVLGNDLLTHGVSFPAGSAVSSDVSLDTYRIGYRYRFDFASTDQGVPQITLAPSIDAAFWSFDYGISGNGNHTSRSYLLPTAQLGLLASWRPSGGPFSVDADLAASPPGIARIPFLAAEQITARYRFLHTGNFDLTGSLGVRFEQFNYFDNQTVPNHIRTDLGPMLVLGVGFDL